MITPVALANTYITSHNSFFFKPRLWHVGIPGLGLKPMPQQRPEGATAVTTPDP